MSQPIPFRRTLSTRSLPAARRPSRRRAFSLLELMIALVVIAISASVAIPRWVETAKRQQLRSATRLIESDLRAALRSAAIRSRMHTLSVQTGTGMLTISPALAGGSAPSSPTIDYALRTAGLVFVTADFDGTNSCKIDMYQRLLSAQTNQPLSRATLQIQIGDKLQTLDLLALMQTPTAGSAVIDRSGAQ